MLYIHNAFTGWSVETLPANQATATTGVCPATDTTSPIPQDPTSYPPNTTANPNNTYNMFCSPDVAVTIPSAAVFLSGAATSAYGQCPETAVTPVVNYPEAATGLPLCLTISRLPPMANTSSALLLIPPC